MYAVRTRGEDMQGGSAKRLRRKDTRGERVGENAPGGCAAEKMPGNARRGNRAREDLPGKTRRGEHMGRDARENASRKTYGEGRFGKDMRTF